MLINFYNLPSVNIGESWDSLMAYNPKKKENPMINSNHPAKIYILTIIHKTSDVLFK